MFFCIDLPDLSSKRELFEIVKIYQINCHSKNYCKYQIEKRRFHFGKFFTSRTIITQP